MREINRRSQDDTEHATRSADQREPRRQSHHPRSYHIGQAGCDPASKVELDELASAVFIFKWHAQEIQTQHIQPDVPEISM